MNRLRKDRLFLRIEAIIRNSAPCDMCRSVCYGYERYCANCGLININYDPLALNSASEKARMAKLECRLLHEICQPIAGGFDRNNSNFCPHCGRVCVYEH